MREHWLEDPWKIALLFIIIGACGTTDATIDRNLILGGDDSVRDRFSFAEVTLQLPGDDHQCGGSVIAPDIILTAAHCRSWVKVVKVHRHDLSDLADEHQTFIPTSMVVHPDFNPVNFAHDFAIIPLDTEIVNAEPVKLNSNRAIPKDGMDLRVLGWGVMNNTRKHQPIYADVLQVANLTAISNDECEATVVKGKSLYRDEIKRHMMCARGRSGVDACSGDSGGPLIVAGEEEGMDLQVGIVSWGRGCALYPGVYSRISSEYQWIRAQVCWFSRSPPAYMQCSDNERGNGDTADSPTVTPLLENTKRGYSTAVVDVTVEIQLDAQSADTGWYIAHLGGPKIIERPFGSYMKNSNQLVVEKLIVPQGVALLFSVQDKSGDGICCIDGREGWYKVSLVTPEGAAHVVVDGSGSFGTRSGHTFVSQFDGEEVEAGPIIISGVESPQSSAFTVDGPLGLSSRLLYQSWIQQLGVLVVLGAL